MTATRDFDARGVATRKVISDGQGNESAGRTRVLDALGRVESVTDQAGGITRYEYTADGLPTLITGPDTVTHMSYDPLSRAVLETRTETPRGVIGTGFDI